MAAGTLVYSVDLGNNHFVDDSLKEQDQQIFSRNFSPSPVVSHLVVHVDKFKASSSHSSLSSESHSHSVDLKEAPSVRSESSDDADTAATLDLSMFDPSVRHTVVGTFKSVAKVLVALVLIFPCMLCLFYGVGWNPKDNYSNIKVAVLDLDGGIIGQNLLAVVQGPAIPVTIVVVPSTTSFADISHQVDIGEFNAALVVNADASSHLMAALTNPSSSYNSAAATSFIFDEGRGGSSMATILRLTVPPLAASTTNLQVATALHQSLSSEGSMLLGGVNGAALARPVGYTEVNLHPVQFAGETVALGLGYVIVWVMMMIVVTMMLRSHEPWDARGVRKDHQMLSTLLCSFLIASLLSFWPIATVRMFGANDFDTPTAFVLWAYIWYTAAVFCSFVLALFSLIGPVKGGGVHSLFLLTNFIASPAVAPVELMYAPLRDLGIALPFQNAVEGTRTILFGSYNVLPRAAGVLAAWLAVCLFVAASIAVYRQRRAAAEAAAAAAAARGPVVVVVEHFAAAAAEAPAAAEMPAVVPAGKEEERGVSMLPAAVTAVMASTAATAETDVCEDGGQRR